MTPLVAVVGDLAASHHHPAADPLGRLAARPATCLPDELTRIDAYLDDERFLAPWRAHSSATLGRPSIPLPTLLRLLQLKHRYGLGYETLCREVSDSISWRRFARIPLDEPVPHPTTLSKLVHRVGPEVFAQRNAVLLGKFAADKLVRCRKLRIDTTVVEADIDFPTDADPARTGGPHRRWAGPPAQGPQRCASDRVSGSQPLGRS
jgi:IS5 family transposase